MRWQRGEGWVVAQGVLLAAIALAPGDLLGLPALPGWLQLPGWLAALAGVLLGLAGARGLGRSLTPLPRPKDDAELVQGGVYAWVRHPIYAGLVVAAVGWSLLRSSLPALLLSVALWLFFEQKALREERWLAQRYPGYEEYRRRVRGRILPLPRPRH